jgi:hypothetical protein
MDGKSLEYQEANQRRALTVEMAGVVLDASGKTVDSFGDKVEADLRPERAEQAKQNGYRYTRRLSLKPGLYQARIGVREPHSGRIGTVMAWLEVPDLRKVKLALSDLFLGGREAARTKSKNDSSASSERCGDTPAIQFLRVAINRIETAAGVIPGMRAAWPIVRGRTLPSFCTTSFDRPDMRV